MYRHLYIPVEVFALGLDVGHAICRNALPLSAGGLFLSCTHLESLGGLNLYE